VAVGTHLSSSHHDRGGYGEESDIPRFGGSDSCPAATSHRSDDGEHSRRSGEWSRNIQLYVTDMTGVVVPHVLLS
jgi:hypothetical protein